MKTTKDEGPEAEKYTIKMNGCHSCPIHCYSDMRVPNSKANGGYEITSDFVETKSLVTVAYIILTEVLERKDKE